MKTKVVRREFLRQAGQGLALFSIQSVVADQLISALVGRAFARAAGAKPANPTGYYLNFSFPGGPPRWCFDLPLTPYGKTASNFKPGGFGTVLTGSGGAIKSAYVANKFTAAGKSLWLPPVWGMNAGGKNFMDLLQHTAFIRGMDMEIDNHDLSNARQVAPIVGGKSLTGIVADGADRPIPAIADSGTPTSQAFRGNKGFSPLTIESGSYLRNTNIAAVILNSFQSTYRKGETHSANNRALKEQAFEQFELFAEAQGITPSALPKMYENAMELVDENIVSLATKWDGCVTKYRTLLKAAMHPKKGELAGIYDKTIPGQNNVTFEASRGSEANRMTHSDLRNLITENTSLSRFAENFAVAELMLDSVTSTMSLAIMPPVKIMDPKGTEFNTSFDQHYYGAVVGTMLNTLTFRAVITCMTELVSALKTKGIFDNTVIHLSAEWSRNPRFDGSGGDHGVKGSNTTLISGMIKKPAVIGNIQIADYNTTYKGTWGVARNYALGGHNRPIQVNDVAQTVSAMLGIDSIVTNGRALLTPKGGSWVPVKDEAKNV